MASWEHEPVSMFLPLGFINTLEDLHPCGTLSHGDPLNSLVKDKHFNFYNVLCLGHR